MQGEPYNVLHIHLEEGAAYGSANASVLKFSFVQARMIRLRLVALGRLVRTVKKSSNGHCTSVERRPRQKLKSLFFENEGQHSE